MNTELSTFEEGKVNLTLTQTMKPPSILRFIVETSSSTTAHAPIASGTAIPLVPCDPFYLASDRLKEPYIVLFDLSSLSLNRLTASFEIEKHENAETTEIGRELVHIFESAKDEHFEDGMESELSRKVKSLVETYGERTINLISSLILRNRVAPEVASEVLSQIGDIDDQKTFNDRFTLLIRALRESKFPEMRLGALLGISFMNHNQISSKMAISNIKAALEKEDVPLLKKRMVKVLAHLESRYSGASLIKSRF
jgi:hypothetical protein